MFNPIDIYQSNSIAVAISEFITTEVLFVDQRYIKFMDLLVQMNLISICVFSGFATATFWLPVLYKQVIVYYTTFLSAKLFMISYLLLELQLHIKMKIEHY
ncbi:hypothetical protein BDA99DRAFT_537536 [Phascolomyces articulosus]|uniref:Uncharacterized protein n=1 Tax=Phascolomyces articulosus TaxID=60185 RepID=A0AAD5PDE4_9FUNG|nr:hypothetical protein BDA99DRAFT_537536 [Phascolomyces articulosus]